MGYFRLINKRGQSSIETAIAFLVTILLFGAIFKIWIWGNKQVVERNKEYQDTRVAAGTSRQDYRLVWPPEKPEELREEEVLLWPPQ